MSRRNVELLLCAIMIVFSLPAAAAGPVSDGYKCPLDPTLTCVMSGLDSPRGLAFGPEGALYVVEAGRGAGPVADPANDPRCTKIGVAVGCYGPTGAVTRLWRGKQEQFATGLPSWAMAGKGNRGIGPADIAFMGRGAAYVTIGLEGDPRLRSANPAFANFATLVNVSASGEWRFIDDIGQWQIDNNVFDTDPYGILAEPGHRLITDAGANSLLRIDANGEISLMATFPSRNSTPPRPSFASKKFNQTTDAVPTSVVTGPDGAYYISELTGIPFMGGTANIYRLDPTTDAIPHTFTLTEAFLTGFKTIIDMDFDADGTLYVLQYSTGAAEQMTGPGVLLRVVPDMTQGTIQEQYQKGTRSTVLAGLTQATSVVVGPDGNLYVTIRGAQAGNGEVILVKP